MVALARNSSCHEVEARASTLYKVILSYIVNYDLPGLHETLFEKIKQKGRSRWEEETDFCGELCVEGPLSTPVVIY